MLSQIERDTKYSKLSKEGRKCLKEWRKARVPEYLEVVPKRRGDKYRLGVLGILVAPSNLYKVMCPNWIGLGNWTTLSNDGERERVKMLFNILQVDDFERMEKKREDRAIKDDGESEDFKPSQFDVVRNISGHEDIGVINRETFTIVSSRDVCPIGLLATKNKAFEGGYEPMVVKLDYNPFNSPKYFYFRTSVGKKSRVKFVNTYRPAEWQERGFIEGAEMPPIFVDFFNHFCLDDISRDVIFAFLYRMIWGSPAKGKGRVTNKVALVLNGGKGVGKNFFSLLCRALAGRDNFVNAKRSIVESNFNKELVAKTCCILDEIRVNTESKMSNLKAYFNDEEQSIEAKGYDAKGYNLFINFVINNNGPADVTISYDDRRFSVVELTEVVLPVAWGNKKVDAFREILEDPDSIEIRQLGSWLKLNAPIRAIDLNYAHKGDRYHEMVLASLEPWQKHLRKKIQEEYKTSELLQYFKEHGKSLEHLKAGYLEKNGAWPTAMSLVIQWLEKYLEKDGRRIGDLRLVSKPDPDNVESDELIDVYTVFHPYPNEKTDDDFFDLI